ncbi:cytochrome c [Olivibacter sp. SDN3]|uniref:c-type cytochrome n=1 Tax=Olivibacter sp. SDN3 TaxID=2764720 RepID=UPI00165189DF|nr:cytochrome c [Olivibacter sp. SDN3]QNL48571.1 cytochrome c [Olivibacter sp. SDN3]
MLSKSTCSLLAILTIVLIIGSCQGEEQIKKAQFFTNGKSLYTSKCENCHNNDGEGLGNLYPPLTDTNFIKQHRPNLPCIVKYGMSKTITINGRGFDTEMPANISLTDQEIAYILTYVGNSFGNELGLITTEEVNGYLKNCTMQNE